MIAHRIVRDSAAGNGHNELRPGWIFARAVPATTDLTGFPKGHVLAATDLARLSALAWDELHLIEPEPEELHEAMAGLRIARAAAGAGVEVGTLGGGHWPLTAAHRGLLRVAVDALTAVNEIAGTCVYSRLDGQVVERDTVVARAKVTPLVVRADAVTSAEEIARRSAGLVRVVPFRPSTIGVVVQETVAPRAVERAATSLGEKVVWLGSQLLPPVVVPASEVAIADAIAALAGGGATIIVLAGAKSLDPLDPAFLALRRLAVDIVRFGVPAHPGSMFWLGRWGDRRLLGLPSCGLFSQLTSFDLILPRVLAGEMTDPHSLAALGHGGLLTPDPPLVPPYAAAARLRTRE